MPKAKNKEKTEKAKASWRAMHKIKVHHNRWLIWAVVVSVLASASLIAYMQVTGIHFDSQFLSSDTTGSNWQSFNHKGIGYTLRYPKSWGVEADNASEITFTNTNDANEYFSVSVYKKTDRPVIMRSLFDTQEEEVVVAGHEGIMISQDKMQAESVIVVEDGNDLYVLRGRGGLFKKIAESFRFTQKLERI